MIWAIAEQLLAGEVHAPGAGSALRIPRPGPRWLFGTPSSESCLVISPSRAAAATAAEALAVEATAK